MAGLRPAARARCLYAGAVAVPPVILGEALGLTPAQVVTLINANLLTSRHRHPDPDPGFWRFGARAAVLGAGLLARRRAAEPIDHDRQGRTRPVASRSAPAIAGGAITVLLAPAISRLLRFFPPCGDRQLDHHERHTARMLAAAIWLGGETPTRWTSAARRTCCWASPPNAITLGIYARFGGFAGNLAVLLGQVAGTATAAVFGLTDFAQVGLYAAWFEFEARPSSSVCLRGLARTGSRSRRLAMSGHHGRDHRQ